MFLSVSGHSNKLTIANHSWPPTVSRLKCVCDTISNWFGNHQPQIRRQKSPSFALLSIHSKLESNGLSIERNHKFSKGTFSTPAIFKATSKLFGSQGCSDDKNWLDFPAFSSRFVDFAAQLCFSCKFSFHEKLRWSQVWQGHDFSPPITILCYA